MASQQETQDKNQREFEEKVRTLTDEELVKEYEESNFFYFDMGGLAATYNLEGKDIPTDEELKAELRKDYIEWLADFRTCLKEGHVWEVEGDFGPDHGSENFHCTRCGQGGQVRYY